MISLMAAQKALDRDHQRPPQSIEKRTEYAPATIPHYADLSPLYTRRTTEAVLGRQNTSSEQLPSQSGRR